VLNSHRKFFLSYVAPVVWSASIVAALVLFGRRAAGYPLAEWAAWGSVAGSALQFLVQLPTVLSVTAGRLRPSLAAGSVHVREVLRNFGPVALGRGVVQVSAYIDQVIASFLPSGAVAALAYAQVLYTLPVSLFGISVSAAELPEMASAVGTDEEVRVALRRRLAAAGGRIAFFVVPSVVALALFGGELAGLLFQRGRFGPSEARYVWSVLAGAAAGLLPATLGRLYASAFYALRDPRTPLRFAALRVALTAVAGYACALPLPRLLGVDPSWGTVGLAAASGAAGWVEFLLLRRALGLRIGRVAVAPGRLLRVWAAAALAALAAAALEGVLPDEVPVFLRASIVLALFGVGYLAGAAVLGEGEAGALLRRLKGAHRR
jgi:putative peptidoglycan lipid II flippase